MTRFVFGLILLAALLAAGLWAQHTMQEIHAPLIARLTQAESAARAGQADAAAELAQSVCRDWQRLRFLTSALADHTPLEEIDALLAQLAVCSPEDSGEFAALCAQLRCRLHAMQEAHRLSPENLL